jgi:hypothetical protein
MLDGFCQSKRDVMATLFAGASVLALGWVLVGLPGRAATTEQVVVDRRGLAIDGYDPVAYFVDGAPMLGKDAFEHTFAGAVWRFRNPGNRSAFIANPEVYMPRFGGYDAAAVAREVAVPGDPRLWTIVEKRLYLFYAPDALRAFVADPRKIIAAAEKNWPVLLRTLTP